MTGNRHEQAVVAVMAYVVGFVTAYIAFGATQVDEAQVVYVTGTQTAQAEQRIDNEPVVAPPDETPEVAPGSSNAAAVLGATYDNGMLSVTNPNGSVVLSVDSEAMPDLVDDPGFAEQGLHDSPPVYAVSVDGDLVYFCEEYTTPGSCRSFVYSSAEGMIFPVTFAGERVEISLEEAATATWNDDILQVAEHTLTDVNGTWNLSVN